MAGLVPAIRALTEGKKDVDARHKAGMTWRTPRARPHRTSTFRNCQGSDVSMSSGNNPGRSDSGVQSV